MNNTPLELNLSVTVYVPSVPNFLRRYGSKDDTITVDIADLSIAQLEAVGKAWTVELLAYAGRRRTIRENERAHLVTP